MKITRNPNTRPVALVGVAMALVASSCGGSDSDSSDASSPVTSIEPAATEVESSAPPTDAPTTDAPATTSTVTVEVSTSTEAPEDVVVVECPAPPVGGEIDRPEPPPPVEPDTVELADTETVDGPLDGRYRTEVQGVAIAFDAAAFSFANLVEPDRIAIGNAPLGYIEMLRPNGLVADESSRQGNGTTPTIDFDTWLALWSDGVEVLADEAIVVGGRDARAVTFATNASTLAPGQIGIDPYVVQVQDVDTVRVVRIDLGTDVDPLFIVFESLSNDEYMAVADQFLASMAIGEPVPVVGPAIAAPAWDTATSEQLVPGPCAVTSVAFGGVDFEVLEDSLLIGLGDFLILRDDEELHTGVDGPLMSVLHAQTTWDDSTPTATGDPVETVVDVVNHLAAQGWTLTPQTETIMLLGAPAEVFDAAGPPEPTQLWRTSDSAVRAGEDFGVGPFRDAEIVVAATGLGVVVAMLESEQDTDDAEILRGRFDRMLETLSSS